METLIAEAFAKIKATEPLRVAKQAARRNLNWSESSGSMLAGGGTSLTMSLSGQQTNEAVLRILMMASQWACKKNKRIMHFDYGKMPPQRKNETLKRHEVLDTKNE